MKQFSACTVALCILLLNTALNAEQDHTAVEPDSPGLALLDQATEAKLRADSIADLGHVILLCQRAKRAGLTGENLEYCNQLLATAQLQRGLALAQQLLESRSGLPNDWQTIRQTILTDLEEGVAVIKDQPATYLRIAQLNLLPDGNEDRARDVLKLAVEHSKNDPPLQFQAIKLLSDLEPDAERRAAVLATAAMSGDPQVLVMYALTLFELRQNEKATEVLRKLVETESGNTGLHERVVALLIDFQEYSSAISIIDTLREKGTDADRVPWLDLMKAEIYAKMEQYEEALQQLDALAEKAEGNPDLMVLTLLLRSSTHLAKEDFENALKDVEAAENVRKDFMPVLEHKFKIFIEQKNYDDALALVKHIQSLSDMPQFALREILVLNELGKHAEAVEVAEKLRQRFPEDESQWIMVLIEIHVKHKAYDTALALVEVRLKEEPNELRWIVAKTQIFTAQERWDEAAAWLESCIDKEPESRELNLLLVSVLFDQKNYRAAKDRIRPLLEKHPDDLGLLRLDSQLSISLGLHVEAVDALSKIVKADPLDYTSVNNLAWILCTSPIDSVRDGPRAVELAERAAEMTRYRRAFVLSTLASAYAEAGDFEKAREISIKSVEVAKAERGMSDKERSEMLEHLQKEWDAFNQDLPFREMLQGWQ